MDSLTQTNCAQPELATLERTNFFPRQLLTDADLKADQRYYREKLRRHNRFLHGWGVVCGLQVTAAPTDEAPLRVQIGAGYALGPQGDEIYVAAPVYLDLAQCGGGAGTDPCDPGRVRPGASTAGGPVYIAIKYAECLVHPVQAMPAGCGCDEEACEYSRIRDSFQIECLNELPPAPPDPEGLCETVNGQQLPACLPCPSNPWVVLALVRPSASGIEDESIDNTVRRQLYSTAVLQEQLIACCCEPRSPEPVRVIRVDPPDGSRFSIPGNEPPERILIDLDKRLQNHTGLELTLTEPGSGPISQNFDVEYIDQQQRIVVVPEKITGAPRDPGNIYTVRLFSAGQDAIRDVDGLALDGDGDGSSGPDFTSSFTVSAPVQ